MKWHNLLRRKKGPPVSVDSTYEEIRIAMETKKINYAYGFGLISEKNRRAQLTRDKSAGTVR